MVKKYAFETQMKSSPPTRSATSAGMTVEVTVASRDVSRLMRESTPMMAQNLGPFSNFGWLSVAASLASNGTSVGSRVEAAPPRATASCCVIVSDNIRRRSSSRCRWYHGVIGRRGADAKLEAE